MGGVHDSLQHQLGEAAGATEDALGENLKLQQQLQELQQQLQEAVDRGRAAEAAERHSQKLRQQHTQELQQQLHELQQQLQEAADCGRAAEAAEEHSQRLRQQHTQDLEQAAQQAREAHEVERSQKSDRC